MASWKEKGVVPDSDDEESLDGDSIASHEDHRIEPRINDLHNKEEIDEKDTGEEDGGYPMGTSIEEAFVLEKTPVNEDTMDEDAVHEEPSLPPHTYTTVHSKSDAIDRRLFSSSSPAVPHIFKVPQALWDPDHDLTDSEIETAEKDQDLPAHRLPVEDEISKSYVRLTSPVSSLLSSPPLSQQGSPSNLQPGLSQNRGPGKPRVPERASSVDSLMNGDALSHIFQEFATPYKRELRQRAPIQLHPYAMEQEKYRQTLKARGMRPMRLAQTQTQDDDHRTVHGSSLPSDSQDLIVEQQTDESQPMDFSWDSDPPSPGSRVVGPVQGSQRSDVSASNDDDEFPDIDKLLQGQHSNSRLAKPKHRLNVYSSKNKRPQLSQIQTHSTRTTNPEHRAAGLFDIPASPPATSSPFPNTVLSKPSTSRAISISSKEPTSSWLDQDELNFQTAPDLPTPATSAIKPVSDPAFLDSDLDEDPFLIALSDPVSSSSDESIQLRKVGKKIRGVLPASHLRLDHQLKKQKPLARTQRESLSASPQKGTIRRGVALPKAPGSTEVAFSSTSNGFSFIFDESDDEEESNGNGTVLEDDVALDGLFAQNRRGYAEEEDRIDAMLPSIKRHKRFSTKPRKKSRVTSASLSRSGPRGHSYQPKITQHLSKESSSTSQPNRRTNKGKTTRKSYEVELSKHRTPKPPRLSILDVTDLVDRTDSKIPQFIKVAARMARSKVGQGRQSPSKKFIRLANREDTVDAQSVLEEWRSGKIKPRRLESPLAKSVEETRSPLGRIADNRQTRLPPPLDKLKPHSQVTKAGRGHLGFPRQLVVSKRRQISMNNYVSEEQPTALPQPNPSSGPDARSDHRIIQRRPANIRYQAPQARPAQLESSEIEYSCQNPAAAFKTTKNALDALFRVNRKRPVQQKNLQLHRFLADDDIARPSIETQPPLGSEVSGSKILGTETLTPVPRQRKRVPQRIDANAAQYRQPSEALVLSLLSPADVQETADQESKLMGLGKFGVRYPTHFDIFPLQPGIFFHESTFIGSGRLSEAIKIGGVIPSGATRGYSTLWLGDKNFRWGPWNEDVSSQIGLVFDFCLEQLLQCSSGNSVPEMDIAELVTRLVDYVQHHLSFASSDGRINFLSRMLEVVQEFSSRTAGIELPADHREAQQGIDVMARCAVLVMQLLQISRAEESALDFQLEDLLKSVAGRCVKLCLNHGLDGVRKLYDDLQYLSFRKRGIRSDQYAAHAWVIVLRVLDTARIPRGSFWDITNTALVEVDVNRIDNAHIMEKMWYSIFSLLPLCEFDEFGVIIPGRRFRVPFDNWSLLQQILKRVFTLYSTNARQSPSFNDYCRALVSRCHFLMLDWGWWKSSGLIGTLFDFFASQNLGHLRNEEVYKSPRFLEELDGEPSLNVEPEDRCFHIFLKIVVLAIKHLREVGDQKSIRNLVARLLPNHDRQYPKEEAVHQRDLAALRNHHDLLCTLYWASPADCRPSLNLIRELVSADRSHKEACLINLRAWGNLSRYVFSSSENETAAYQQFIDWQDAFFEKLLHQYLDADSDVRRQAELLLNSSEGSITEAQLQKTIASNKRNTMATIQVLIYDLFHNISNARDANATLSALNFKLLCKILTPRIFGVYKEIDQSLVGSAVNALNHYMKRADMLHPFSGPQFTLSRTEVDSQDSLDFANVDIERQILIFPLHEFILPNFATIIRDILESRLYQPDEPDFMESLISCWAHLVSLVTEDKYELKDFITSGTNALFENRQQHTRANKYWPLFLSQLLRDKKIDGLKVAGFDLGAEWMQVVTRDPGSLTYEPQLSRCFYEQGHYLLKPNPELSDFDWLSADQDWPNRHQYLLNVALNSMRMIKIDPAHGGFADSHHFSEKERQSLLSATLKCTMDSMQRQLESMIPQSASHIKYVQFCQNAVSYLRSYTNNIRPVNDFFIRHSVNYWPKGDDPQLYGAGIVSYSLRLNDQPGKTSFELFHYLYSGWKNDQVRSRLDNHITCVRKGMNNWSFTEFMLANFVPATLLVGFNTIGGSVLPKIYLRILSKRAPHYLQRNGSEGASMFKYMINIMKMIINGISTRAMNAGVRESMNHWVHTFEDGVRGVHPNHRGIISIVCQFWIAIRPALLDYVGKYPAEALLLNEVTNPMNYFFRKAACFLGQNQNADWDLDQLEVATGEYVNRFVAALRDDIENHWMLSRDRNQDSVWIKVPGGGGTTISLVDGVSRFEDVLKLGMCYLDDLVDVNEGSRVRPSVYSSPDTAFPGVFGAIF